MTATTARPGADAPAGAGHNERTVGSLLSGIVGDVQDLTRQQMSLLKAELSSDLKQGRQAAIGMGIGVSLLSVGGIIVSLALVHLVEWLFGWHESAACALVGGVILAVGAAVVFSARSKLETLNLLPNESLQTLKENVTCVTTKN